MMTDNEIIKALECRVKSKCPECPYFHSFPCDKCKKLDKDALDLINRQKAKIVAEQNYADCLNTEIDRLKQNLEEAHVDIREHLAENERLKEKIFEEHKLSSKIIEAHLSYEKELKKWIKTAKAEAYKEFWNSRPERLNEQCEGKEEYNKGWNACLDEFWDIRNNLFEELEGEDNAK